MKVIKVKDYDELSKVAADYFIEKIKKDPSMTLGLATGSTPIGMYQYLIKDHKENQTSYENIITFNLDEYIGLDESNKNSYKYFMNDQLFHHINIDPANVHIPNGKTDNSERECELYEEKIKEKGGIDLQLLGIGANGHIGFNEPGTSFKSRTHVVKLAEKTRSDNARFFEKIEDVPTHAITMGIQTIMESKEIVLLASGEGKRETIKRLLTGPISEDFPASCLHNHPNVTVIVDEEALGDIDLKNVKG